jgi:hypothetical protein
MAKHCTVQFLGQIFLETYPKQYCIDAWPTYAFVSKYDVRRRLHETVALYDFKKNEVQIFCPSFCEYHKVKETISKMVEAGYEPFQIVTSKTVTWNFLDFIAYWLETTTECDGNGNTLMLNENLTVVALRLSILKNISETEIVYVFDDEILRKMNEFLAEYKVVSRIPVSLECLRVY